MPILGMTADELDVACNKLWDHLTDGKSDEEARRKLKLSPAHFQNLRRAMYARQAELLKTRTAEEVYIQYTIDQIRNIKDLTSMIKEFKDSKQYNAFVGAVKARADLNDKLLKMGQDLGIIDYKPESEEIIGGITVSGLSSKQLKTMIVTELGELQAMMKGRTASASIIEMPLKPTHIPARKQKALPEKTVGGKAMRVQKGRRRVIKKVKVTG